MIVKKVNNNTIDVFLGEGWENWGRFKIKYGKEHNQVFQIKGIRFSKHDFAEVERKQNAH